MSLYALMRKFLHSHPEVDLLGHILMNVFFTSVGIAKSSLRILYPSTHPPANIINLIIFAKLMDAKFYCCCNLYVLISSKVECLFSKVAK